MVFFTSFISHTLAALIRVRLTDVTHSKNDIVPIELCHFFYAYYADLCGFSLYRSAFLFYCHAA